MKNTHSENAKSYELMVIVDPDIGEIAIKSRLDKIRSDIASANGEITHEEIWGLRDLAYSIKKRDRGFYAVIDFMYEPENVKVMDKVLRLETDVLRHLIVLLPDNYEPKNYQAEEEAEKLEREEKAKDKKERPMPLVPRRKTETVIAQPVKVEPKAPEAAPVKAEKAKKSEEEAPKKAAKKKDEPKQQSLEDIDAKLSSIIENPDINF